MKICAWIFALLLLVLTGQSVMAQEVVVTDTVAMTATAPVTATNVLTDSVPVTETAAMTATASVTATAPMTATGVVTDSVPVTATGTLTAGGQTNSVYMPVTAYSSGIYNFYRALYESIGEFYEVDIPWAVAMKRQFPDPKQWGMINTWEFYETSNYVDFEMDNGGTAVQIEFDKPVERDKSISLVLLHPVTQFGDIYTYGYSCLSIGAEWVSADFGCSLTITDASGNELTDQEVADRNLDLPIGPFIVRVDIRTPLWWFLPPPPTDHP